MPTDSATIENAKEEYRALLQACTERALFKYRERYLLEVIRESNPPSTVPQELRVISTRSIQTQTDISFGNKNKNLTSTTLIDVKKWQSNQNS